MRMWPCLSIDFTFSDFLFGARRCLSRRTNEPIPIHFESEAERTFLTLSVRAAFDLYLVARNYSPQDECIFVGINVPEMVAIARLHGLTVKAVDIDPLSTEICLEQLKARLTSCTRFVLVPHLFGARVDLRGLSSIAQQRGIDVIEDCAQAYSGRSWSGSPTTTASLFSFGPMKTATALQGGIAVVRDPQLRESMQSILASYPPQPTWRYFARLCRFALLARFSNPWLYGIVVAVFVRCGIDHEALIHRATRSANIVLTGLHRQRPCEALQCMVRRKLTTGNAHFEKRREAGCLLHSALSQSLRIPQRDHHQSAFWVVPVLSHDVDSLKHRLRLAGFDALSSRLVSVGCSEIEGATELAQAVLLPFAPAMPREELVRLGKLVSKIEASIGES